jgi:hypothetical protein
MTDSRRSRPERRSSATRSQAAQVSWRGVALLAVTGAVGLVLAVHGWSARSGTTLPGQIAGHSRAAPDASASPKPATTGTASPASRQPGPVASTHRTPSSSPSAAASIGPLLASQSYAQYSYEVWPGPLSPAAKTAMTGLSISVSRTTGGVRVVAGVVGQAPAQPKVYVGGVKVYVVEASLGDDSNNADYNLGDDALVVTNAAGRILR